MAARPATGLGEHGRARFLRSCRHLLQIPDGAVDRDSSGFDQTVGGASLPAAAALNRAVVHAEWKGLRAAELFTIPREFNRVRK